MPELADADPNTPGFQVDLYDGVNHITIYVYPIDYCDPGSGYDLGITRAEGSVSLVRPNRPPTGSIAIEPNYTGSNYGACIGCTLSAVDYSINDRDGLTDATFSYQWLADDVEIPGATSSSYTAASADEGNTIKVRVSFTDDAGNDETLTSSATAAVTSNSAATGAPVITGTAHVGETLTATTAGIVDADGLVNVSYSYQWISNDGSSDTDIQNATGSSYTLVAGDEGNTIKVRVSFTDDAGNDETLTSSATAAVTSNSAATGAPRVVGVGRVGNTLTVDTFRIADANGLVNVFYSYQWISNDGSSDTDIQNATGSSYTVSIADRGKAIKVRVSFTDDRGTDETLTSSATAAVAAQAEPVSFITVEVTADRYHREAQFIAATWTDVDDCSTDYNAYLHIMGEVDELVHLGSATSNGTEIAKWVPALRDDIDGYPVELYCGTDAAGRLVSGVSIPSPANGTFSSEPPLRGLSVGHGTLSPIFIFDKNRISYNVLDVANDVTRTTITATPKTGYFVKYYESSEGGWTSSSSFLGVPDHPGPDADCNRRTTDGLGPMPELTDADPNTPGFQVDLYDGVNYVSLFVYPVDYCHPGSGYDLGITRAEGSVSLVRPNRPPTGSIAIRPNYTGYTYGPCIGCILSVVDYSINDRDGLTDATYSYQWLADDVEIAGATSSSYTVASAVEGKAIKVRVSFTDDRCTDESLTSSATADAASNLAITGTAWVGNILTADTSGIVDADGLVNVSYSYQWISNDGSSDTDIQNATGSSYTLVAGDEGNTIKVRVSFTDDADNDETLTSSATAAVTSNSAATGAPRVVGVGRVGNTLTVDTFRIADANGLVNVFYSYQWISNDGSSDTDIQNATGSSYTVSIADRGKTIKVRASFTDDRGTDETLTSSATAAVAAQAEPVSFITVEVTADRYHREAQLIAATWTDVDDCSTNYNAYLHYIGEVDEVVHLGSATSSGTEITKVVRRPARPYR